MTLLRHSDKPQFKFQIEYLNSTIQYTNLPIHVLINQALLFEGASVRTREQYARSILKIKKLIPIMIYATKDFVLFPTTSKSDNHYMLLNSKHILNIDTFNTFTEIYFKNDATILIKQNHHMISRKLGESLRLIHHQKMIQY